MNKFLTTCTLLTIFATPAWAQGMKVVTSIKPVHSLVASVMAGVDTPYLLLQGGASAHTYALKPSDAEALQDADLVFWVGPDMESFLRNALDTLATDAQIVTLAETPDLITLPFREGGAFDAHEHDEEHDEDQHHDDEHEEHEDEEAHDDHEEIDMHLWLDPANAKAMLHHIEQTMSAADPDNALAYKANTTKTALALDALIDEINAILAPVKDHPFIVFHDAYQYFERQFGVTAAGSITVNPDAIPGVQRLVEMREKINQLGATCVFAEPQFEPKLVTLAIEGTNAKTGTLDPLGAQLPDGPGLYFELMRNMAVAIKECLSA